MRDLLDQLYDRYNARRWVHPDPLEFLYRYPSLRDREVAGLVAASLAYGRVKQILKSVSAVLEVMGDSPHDFVRSVGAESLSRTFEGFRHRFTGSEDLVMLLNGMGGVIREHQSLHACFMEHFHRDHETVLPALSGLAGELSASFSARCNSLLPAPQRGSACKRLHLFVRWMVREDQVDPGGWRGIPRTKLVVPLDTHMHRICRGLGLTRRKQADMRTALEVTRAFRAICPKDPVRYDFALSRLGIRGDLAAGASLNKDALHLIRERRDIP